MSTEKTNSKAVEFIYQDTEIHFLLGLEKNVMVNATEMAKVFGKRTSDFLQNQSTKDFINEVELTLKSVNSETKMYENRGQSGMYFERRLALKFASWLDVKFEVWVFDTIDEILFGKAKNVASKISDTEKKKLEISILLEKIKKLENEDVNKFILEIEELKKMENEKKKAVRQFSSQYKMF